MEYILFLVLLGLSGFFSSIETAFFSLTDTRIRMMRENGVPNAELVGKLRSHPKRLLITILIGNNIVNLFTAAYATFVATRSFGSAGVGIATGVTTFFILVFGEIIPKSFAYTHNSRIASFAATPVYFIYLALLPVSTLLLQLDTFLHRVSRTAPALGVSESEIRAMARLGVERGAIEYRERELIENVFRFDDVEAGEVMTPLYRVEMLNGSAPVEQVAYFISYTGFSRYPVYDDNYAESIIGYIHMNRVMQVLNSDKRDRPVSEFVSPLTSISEDIKIEKVFRLMKKDRSHMYLVHRKEDSNEPIGIITMEEVLEVIVGDIKDETDE